MCSPKLRRLGIVLLIVAGIALVVHHLYGKQTASSPYAYSDQFIKVLRGPPVERVAADGAAELRILLDLRDFNYTLQPPPCEAGADELLATLIITSYVGHDELRSAHRRAMPATLLEVLGIRRVFLLAAIPSAERYITQAAVEAEHRRFGDLLQGNFVEAYRNLTYKHTMGLRWAADGDGVGSGSGNCAAKFIVKADDDTVFDLYHLHAHLLELTDTDHLRSDEFLAGFVLAAQRPIRTVANKWYVSSDEYAADVYPDYLSGWLYLTNGPTAGRLVERARGEPRFLWIDDTWVTGVLREPLGIALVPLNRWFSANAEFLDCCIADMRRWRVRCDYYVGPNGGDGRLLGEFARAVERCYVEDEDGEAEGGCLERRPEQSLAMTCVAQGKRLVEEHGRAVVQSVRL